MNAIVSSPAGNSAAQRSPERMAAIGRVFENQGKYTQAQAMYRKALSSDPNSQIAIERLNAIATMNSKRSFDPKTQKPTTESLLAVADALNGADRKPKRLGSGQKATPLLRTVESINIATPQPEALVASLVVPADDSTLPIVEVRSLTVAEPEPTADLTELVNVETMGGLALANPGWKLDESFERTAEDATGLSRSLDSTHELPEISTVVFEGSQDGVATIATMDDSWKSSKRTVSLDQVMEWYDSPATNTDNLLLALMAGENDAVKAFAATLLAECPTDNPEINAALRNIDANASAMLRVSSRDTLIQRGDIDDGIVNDLLNLLVDSDPNVQSQAAASLRNVAGTAWASQCVTQLTEMLSDGDPRVETVAAATLGDFGTDAVSSRSMLMDVAANRAEESTRAAAELALNRIPVADLTLPAVEFSVDDQYQDDQFEPVISVDGYLPIVE